MKRSPCHVAAACLLTMLMAGCAAITVPVRQADGVERALPVVHLTLCDVVQPQATFYRSGELKSFSAASINMSNPVLALGTTIAKTLQSFGTFAGSTISSLFAGAAVTKAIK